MKAKPFICDLRKMTMIQKLAYWFYCMPWLFADDEKPIVERVILETPRTKADFMK